MQALKVVANLLVAGMVVLFEFTFYPKIMEYIIEPLHGFYLDLFPSPRTEITFFWQALPLLCLFLIVWGGIMIGLGKMDVFGDEVREDSGGDEGGED